MRGLLLLFSTLFLLDPTEGNQAYAQLTEDDRIIVDRAIKKANGNFGTNHIDFFSIRRRDDREQFLEMHLKTTSCKTKESVHQPDCPIEPKGAPQVICLSCKKKMDCLLRANADEILKIRGNCLHLYGGRHPMPIKFKEEELGCLGCI